MGQGWIFLILTIFLWGLTPILEKSGLRETDVFSALFIRSMAVSLVLVAVFALSGRMGTLGKIHLKNIVLFSISGICAGLLAMWTYFKVLQGNPSSKIVPLAATYPLVTALLSIVILREQVSWQRIVGTVLIVVGILLVK
jgi:transporter family protein